jgi:hypothetical protein
MAAIHSQATSYKVDYRMNYHEAVIEPHELPKHIVAKLMLLMKKLGLVYGAIDMRRNSKGNMFSWRSIRQVNGCLWKNLQVCLSQPRLLISLSNSTIHRFHPQIWSTHPFFQQSMKCAIKLPALTII